MKRIVSHAPVIAAMLASAAILASCGGSGGLLSASESASLNRTLDAIDAAVAARDCTATEIASARLRSQTDGLGSGVDQALRDDLAAGAAKVSSLSIRDCANGSTTTSSTTSTTSTTPTSSSSSSTSTSSSTTSTTTTTTPTTTTTAPTTTTSTSTNGGGAGPGN